MISNEDFYIQTAFVSVIPGFVNSLEYGYASWFIMSDVASDNPSFNTIQKCKEILRPHLEKNSPLLNLRRFERVIVWEMRTENFDTYTSKQKKLLKSFSSEDFYRNGEDIVKDIDDRWFEKSFEPKNPVIEELKTWIYIPPNSIHFDTKIVLELEKMGIFFSTNLQTVFFHHYPPEYSGFRVMYAFRTSSNDLAIDILTRLSEEVMVYFDTNPLKALLDEFITNYSNKFDPKI